MADLPMRPDLDELRRKAEESDEPSLAAAQEAVARDHGFADWAQMAIEVERRAVFDGGDVPRLRAMLAERPELATRPMEHWCDHRRGADPLGYLAMLRFDARRLGLPAELPNVGEMARMLLAAGAYVDGPPGASETTLMTAASYGDPEVAGILVEAGADLTSTAAPHAGGVPGGTALRHAAVFGMTAVVDLLVASGSPITDLAEAAAAGDVTGRLTPQPPLAERVYALRLAAGNERLSVIDELLAAGTPVDGLDADGSTALHEAAYYGRPASVRHLLAAGADPNLRDTTYRSTPLGWCRHQHEQVGASPGHEHVEKILAPVTDDVETNPTPIDT